MILAKFFKVLDGDEFELYHGMPPNKVFFEGVEEVEWQQ